MDFKRSYTHIRIEHLGVFVQRKPIGHPGDVVAYCAVQSISFDALLSRTRQLARLGDVGGKEFAQQPIGLRLHADDARVSVHAREQKILQAAIELLERLAESDQIVIALRDRHFPVEYLVAPDEGHGFARPVNNMAMFAAAEKFLAKHLGGRYQEGGTPEVINRLKEITVDPVTVVLPKKEESTAGAP